jgi:hypothetical protein
MTQRRTHQQRVATLLDEVDERRRHLETLRAGGVQAAGLRDLQAELAGVRQELAAAVSAASS